MPIYSEYNLIINNFRDKMTLDFIHFIEVSIMGLLENARYVSIERGYDYYKKRNVISFKQTSENEYEGKVSGSAKKLTMFTLILFI